MTVQTYACPVCSISTSFTFPADQYNEWLAGKDAAEAFTGISEAEAWLLVSGIHPVCWESFRLEDPHLKGYARRVGIKPTSWEGATDGG